MKISFSIVQTIDIEKLICEIDHFIHATGDSSPYIFMSKDTANAITYDVASRVEMGNFGCSGVIGRFYGYKVFEDNSIKFGKVEIK